MKKSLIFLFIAGAAVYLGLGYHFILFDDSLRVMKKLEFRTHNTFVDARGANSVKLLAQSDLVQAGVKELIGQQKGLKIPLPKLN
ncbi:MAG: hypothetical protein HQK55_14835 [Deltaproteobacteria bacterium]|nr:hypothetical protein [Deltaproteobacteria bacterium]